MTGVEATPPAPEIGVGPAALKVQSAATALPPLAPQYATDEVGQLAEAFDSTLGKLHQSLEREKLFNNDVSHELRTPLMIIASSCELLAETELSSREHEQVTRITKASNEMRDLVQTFLQLARGKAEVDESANCSLAEIADEQFRHWQPLFQAKNIDFNCRKEGKNYGYYSPTLLRTVMTNLLRNALHYTESGYVNLVLEADGFRVEDTGEGVDSSETVEIFQPFFRGSLARGEGLGLGLSLVKRICTHQGWGITLTPRDPQGCCFYVVLNNLR